MAPTCSSHNHAASHTHPSSGYLAFGDAVCGDLLTCFSAAPDGSFSAVVPSWTIRWANAMVFVHVIPSYALFSHPIFSAVERAIARARPALAGGRSRLTLRLTWRSAYVAVVCLLAACLPFFNDIVGLIGAIGGYRSCSIVGCTSDTGRAPASSAERVHRPLVPCLYARHTCVSQERKSSYNISRCGWTTVPCQPAVANLGIAASLAIATPDIAATLATSAQPQPFPARGGRAGWIALKIKLNLHACLP